MKNKLKLKFAVVCSVIGAAFRSPDALALANDNPPPPDLAKDDAVAPAATAENPAEVLKQRDADEKAIREMVAGGLERPQAEAALRHKKEFAERHAALQKENKTARRR